MLLTYITSSKQENNQRQDTTLMSVPLYISSRKYNFEQQICLMSVKFLDHLLKCLKGYEI